jgi:hypothetical protein
VFGLKKFGWTKIEILALLQCLFSWGLLFFYKTLLRIPKKAALEDSLFIFVFEIFNVRHA